MWNTDLQSSIGLRTAQISVYLFCRRWRLSTRRQLLAVDNSGSLRALTECRCAVAEFALFMQFICAVMSFVGGGAGVWCHDCIPAADLYWRFAVVWFLLPSLSERYRRKPWNHWMGEMLLAHINKTSWTAKIKAQKQGGAFYFKDDKWINSKTVRMAYIFRNPPGALQMLTALVMLHCPSKGHTLQIALAMVRKWPNGLCSTDKAGSHHPRVILPLMWRSSGEFCWLFGMRDV